ncbi:MAG TPA: hypothetical protein VMG36_08385 [Thermoplasmata archaeon]|nr:hypothetical protein [Thermoplasmata archaeon]
MPRSGRFSERIAELVAARRELQEELSRLGREEEYLRLKVRQAQEQVHYYEGLLALLRRDWGKESGLSELVRRLG